MFLLFFAHSNSDSLRDRTIILLLSLSLLRGETFGPFRLFLLFLKRFFCRLTASFCS